VSKDHQPRPRKSRVQACGLCPTEKPTKVKFPPFGNLCLDCISKTLLEQLREIRQLNDEALDSRVQVRNYRVALLGAASAIGLEWREGVSDELLLSTPDQIEAFAAERNASLQLAQEKNVYQTSVIEMQKQQITKLMENAQTDPQRNAELAKLRKDWADACTVLTHYTIERWKLKEEIRLLTDALNTEVTNRMNHTCDKQALEDGLIR
jgi:hypothetical protein